MIPPEDREKLVEGYVATGMDRARARLIVDVGAKAAEDAIMTMCTASNRVGDQAGNIAAQAVAVQLVLAECSLRLALMLGAAERHDLPTGRVEL
jgi:hypothetical protein